MSAPFWLLGLGIVLIWGSILGAFAFALYQSKTIKRKR
jgi:hypothetical protein